MQVFADLHIHTGSAGGGAVKVTASRSLTIEQAIFADAPAVGLQVIALVDGACSGVWQEWEELLCRGRLRELPGGGFMADNGVLAIAASEFESREGAHFLAYLPDRAAVREWQGFLHSRVSNPRLSTQRARTGIAEALQACQDCGGIFCPAHAFTPHKGVYGAVAPRLADILGPRLEDIKVVELGLSADSALASRISETDRMSFISNSDAHSSKNVGREYNLLEMRDLDFGELKMALNGQKGRGITANYGFNPLLGKYHRSYCPECQLILDEAGPVDCCRQCGSTGVVLGVYDRIAMIADRGQAIAEDVRPPYRYRVPLGELPGIGPKALKALLAEHTALEVGELLDIGEIAKLAGRKPAEAVQLMRDNGYRIEAGGGGRYGRVRNHNMRG